DSPSDLHTRHVVLSAIGVICNPTDRLLCSRDELLIAMSESADDREAIDIVTVDSPSDLHTRRAVLSATGSSAIQQIVCCTRGMNCSSPCQESADDSEAIDRVTDNL
ncbi:hypothetical protein CEXT_58261, partial [Caerostris extrusa]